jgi:hypothetical protein
LGACAKALAAKSSDPAAKTIENFFMAKTFQLDCLTGARGKIGV